jgi:hypothetical protein
LARRASLLLGARASLFLAAALTGCSRPGQPGDAALLLLPHQTSATGALRFERQDSAGIELVLNGEAGAWGGELLSLSEFRVLGVIDGAAEQELSGVSAVAIDERGDMYVGSARSGSIRVFDAGGRFLRDIGRKGRGPAEFAVISRIWFEGDTVFVEDRNLSRSTALSRGGLHLATWNGYTQPEGWVYVLAGPRGGWLAEVRPRGQPDLAAARSLVADSAAGTIVKARPIQVRRFLPESNAVGELVVEIPQPVEYVDRFAERGVTTPLFTVRPAFGVDERGRVFVTRLDDYRIDVFDTAGRHARSVRRPWRPIAVGLETVEEMKALIDIHYDTLSRGDWSRFENVVERWAARKRMKELIDRRAQLPLPTHRPALGRLLVSRDGSFWVERIDAVPTARYEAELRGHAGPRPSRWELFDAEGRFLSTVELPPRFYPVWVDGPSVTGIRRDDLEVEYVVTLRAQPARSRADG